MHEEPAYATFPPAGFAPPELPLLPGQVPQHSNADFESMKRSFEATAISAANEQKQRFANAPGQQQQQQLQQFPQGPQAMMGGAYTEVYGGAQGGSYGGGYGAGAPPFVPQAQLQAQAAAQQQAQQQQGTPQSNQSGFSNPGSPYLGVGTPNPVPFGSPSSQNGNLPQPGSFNGSTYSGQFDTMPSSPNPNPYSPNPYAGFGGLGFNNQAFMGMMPGMLGMGSPQLGGSMQMQQGMGFGMPFPMMGQQGMGIPTATTQTVRSSLPFGDDGSLPRSSLSRDAPSTSATFPRTPPSTSSLARFALAPSTRSRFSPRRAAPSSASSILRRPRRSTRTRSCAKFGCTIRTSSLAGDALAPSPPTFSWRFSSRERRGTSTSATSTSRSRSRRCATTFRASGLSTKSRSFEVRRVFFRKACS